MYQSWRSFIPLTPTPGRRLKQNNDNWQQQQNNSSNSIATCPLYCCFAESRSQFKCQKKYTINYVIHFFSLLLFASFSFLVPRCSTEENNITDKQFANMVISMSVCVCFLGLRINVPAKCRSLDCLSVDQNWYYVVCTTPHSSLSMLLSQ